MNLIIDQGNSFTKIAIFKGENIVQLSNIKSNDRKTLLSEIIQIIKKEPLIKKAIFSSVSSEHIELKKRLSEKVFFIDLTHQTPVPIINLYKTIETLGKDRLAAIVAANNIFPKTNVLVFDFGTALTIDFINENNEYSGGNISPGLLMRFHALHHFTQKLPNIEPNFSNDKLIGSTTEEAIISGVQNGILNEVEGYIQKFTDQYQNLKIIITGGDIFFFEKQLKNKIFADPNLVLKGLNLILEYNAL